MSYRALQADVHVGGSYPAWGCRVFGAEAEVVAAVDSDNVAAVSSFAFGLSWMDAEYFD